FFIVKPTDSAVATGKVTPSGLMWHDVPNRGGRVTISIDLRAQGDIGLSSGWQGDNAGATVVPANADSLVPVAPSSNEWVKTPVVGTKGMILRRIINKPFGPALLPPPAPPATPNPDANPTNQPPNVMGNPIPYVPAAST